MTPYRDSIIRLAPPLSLDPDLVEAVVIKESSANEWAWNPEPHYRYLWNVRTKAPFRPLLVAERAAEVPPPDFPALAGDRDQEWWAQQASWGLMQVMGAVARERGFNGPYLSQLCTPSINLHIGCTHLAKLVKWADGDVRQALAAYNGGKGNWKAADPQRYAVRVLALQESVKAANR